MKRYFIAIQGFTDKTGSAVHLSLSRRRAEAVQTYLVAQHNIPVYRIQIVGLGKDKPLNEQKTRTNASRIAAPKSPCSLRTPVRAPNHPPLRNKNKRPVTLRTLLRSSHDVQMCVG